MVRMTDLLKKAKKQIGAFRAGGAVPPPPPIKKERPPIVKKRKRPISEKKPVEPTAPEKEKPPEKERPPAEEPVEFAEMFLERAKEPSLAGEDITTKFMKTPVPDEEEAKKLYFEARESIRGIFDAYKDGGPINEKKIMDIAHKIVNNILSGSRILLKLFHEVDSLKYYIYHNAVNVSILSVETGIAYNYNKSTLIDLAVTGLLHDMDLIKSKHIIDKPEKLDEKELEEIKKHPLSTATFVDNAFKFTKEIVNSILQHHERKDGQGYPAGLTDAEIQDLAEIVGIADTYESMTHSRPHKEKMSAHAAILRIITTGKNLFSNEVIKALVSRVGLYPVGSWIQLNTGEICKVLEVNPDFPLRPVISILMDKDKRKFREIRTIDLQKIPSLYIKNIVEKTVT